MFQKPRIYPTLMYQMMLAYLILTDQSPQTDQIGMYQNLHTLT
ncbi:hypothetical protein NTGHW29_210002 [Candidatus Nitrotoga sp. HW29]|nr:hypothetical protein NTGHW29_210002 [Candidatus Nitrotoga sp. HW29]